jgi:hypothetical protein
MKYYLLLMLAIILKDKFAARLLMQNVHAVL